MTDLVNIHQAKSTLSKLIERVESGEEIVIARAGKPVARLVPYRVSPPDRAPGSLRGLVVIHGELEDPILDAEIAQAFEQAFETLSDR